MTCPHCGGRDHIESNGEDARSPGYTLLCLAPCEPDESTYDHLPDDDPHKRTCGMQWMPNEPN